MSKLVLWPFLNWINPIFGNGASIWGWSMMRGGISLISRYTVALMNWCWWFYLLDKNTGDGDIPSLILVPLVCLLPFSSRRQFLLELSSLSMALEMLKTSFPGVMRGKLTWDLEGEMGVVEGRWERLRRLRGRMCELVNRKNKNRAELGLKWRFFRRTLSGTCSTCECCSFVCLGNLCDNLTLFLNSDTKFAYTALIAVKISETSKK